MRCRAWSRRCWRWRLGPGRPPRLLALPGFFTLAVGSLGLRGLTSLAGGHPVRGFHDLLSVVTTVVAIAVGLLVGSVLAQHLQPLSASPDYPAAPGPPLP